MANKYVGDLCFSNGEYELNGETKKRWTKAAVIFENQETGRRSYKFECFPAGEWSGFMSEFPPKNKPITHNQVLEQTGHMDIKDEPINLSEIPF